MGPNRPPDDSFYQQILSLEVRLSTLNEAAPLERGRIVDVALEELKVSLEELHVAHEEMQQQNRELEEARYFLEDERQRYQELFDLAPDGYLVTDRHGVIGEANQMLARQVGCTTDFLIGKPLVLLIAAEDQQDFSRLLHRLGQHGQAGEFEARLQPRDGAVFSVRFTISPMRDSRGHTIGLRWLVHDSSERNRLEVRRIRQRVAELSSISQSITSTLEMPVVLQEIVSGACYLTGARYGALGIFTPSGQIEQFVTHGLSGEERDLIGPLPEGGGLLGLLHQDGQPRRLADLSQQTVSAGFPPHHPPMKTFLGVPVRFNDSVLANLYLTEKLGGQEFTQDDEDLLILFASQAALAINNVSSHRREQAERKNAEQAVRDLQRSEAIVVVERQRLVTLVETSPVGILVLEASGEISLMNREAQRILGMPHQPEYDVSWYADQVEFLRPDGSSYSPDQLPVNRAFHLGESARAVEMCYRFPDGHEAHTLVNVTPVLTSNGEVTAALVALQDMEPLREVEKQRSEFLAMISHELRTPITAIKGAAASMLGSRQIFDPQEAREFFQIIDEHADHLTDLVRNLLDLTRIEAGTLSVNPESMSLREVLDDTVATFRRSGNTQEVQINLPEGLPAVLADRRRIGQVLTNLLGNAAKFSPPSAPIVIQVEQGPTHVNVSVKDSGRGIPQDALPKLFQKFSHVYETTDSKNGTGLGLVICKGIVEAHGGRIWTDSPGNGQGATFNFTLPLATEAPGKPGTTEVGSPAFAGSVRPTSQLTRILAVDDDPHVLRYLRRLMEEVGFEIHAVDDPGEVIRLVELVMPDLVILDLKLPNANGLELLRQIREFSTVSIIFLTAQDDNETVVSALRAGADDYITKPFSGSELLARIDTILHRRSDSGQDSTLQSLVLDDLRVDFAQRKVTVSDHDVALTATEYNLLHSLARNAGRVLTHDQLLQMVWGNEYSGETEIVRSMIRNLRAKLGDNGHRPKLILTHTGVGYSIPKP